MRSIARTLALATLIFTAAPATAAGPKGCTKGTLCRQVIDNGYKSCRVAIQKKWRAIRDLCRAAKKAGNTASCQQAITAGFQSAPTGERAAGRSASGLRALSIETAATCPPGFPVDCGGGQCCPSNYPNCVVGECCPPGYPIGCGTFCCPSTFPICGDDGLCHQPATTTTIVYSCPAPTTTLPEPTGCVNSNDACSTTGCSGLPAGGCSYRCPARTAFACIGFVSTYSTCNSDSDCPADSPMCVGRGFDDTCDEPAGICASPCQ